MKKFILASFLLCFACMFISGCGQDESEELFEEVPPAAPLPTCPVISPEPLPPVVPGPVEPEEEEEIEPEDSESVETEEQAEIETIEDQESK